MDSATDPKRHRTGNGKLIRRFDLAATAVFAIEGAAIAGGAHLDLFGVVVLGCVTAMGGGILRDLLIGSVPPAALTDKLYIPLSVVVSLITFALHHPVGQIPTWLLTGLDAAGLGLFCASGSVKALDHGLLPVSAAFLGTLTAVGGGAMSAVLIGRVPSVLRVDIYAVAALLGAAIVVTGVRRQLPTAPTMLAGGGACFVLRVLSAWQHWNLPRIH